MQGELSASMAPLLGLVKLAFLTVLRDLGGSVGRPWVRSIIHATANSFPQLPLLPRERTSGSWGSVTQTNNAGFKRLLMTDWAGMTARGTEKTSLRVSCCQSVSQLVANGLRLVIVTRA